MTPISVVIADDDVRLRCAVRLLVDDDPGMVVVAEAANGEDAVDMIRRLQPDVALLDIRMPHKTGLEAARELVAVGSRTRMVMLTMFDLDQYVYDALRVGACGFLLKNAPPAELLRAIRVAADNNALLAPEVTRRLIGRFSARCARNDKRLSVLTGRETETLTLIAQGFSNSEIASRLCVTATTVRTYVSRILSKLGARDRAQLVVFAYECGLVGGVFGDR